MEMEECYEVCPGDKGLNDACLRPKIAGGHRYNLRRKADAVEHAEAPTRARKRRLRKKTDLDDDTMVFAQTLEAELLRYFETEKLMTGSDEDDDVMEISHEEFLGSSAAAAVPPRTAPQPETGAASCVRTSSLQHGRSADGDDDVIEFCAEIEKSMVASSPERSSTPKSALTDDEDEDYYDDMCGLACPPMDDASVELIFSEPLVQFDPDFIEELLSDL